ncbi:Bromodomain transcription factor [Penicillium expansum]|uniref:SAGA complex subunit Spt7 n=1 Tax=Penicillium expansum TaxID=27334 RepID=A0A0A2JC43_PENEN|nr:Bromodomain transcription factor [Penicillium expansum]KGO36924.1 Bromodomain transcription factor [Penicillium expansum]KGO51411.1 Bromodomain transcription factor [Penicillium expansum]KGO52944.1 Bromodomain transcription factor [Penicillium expansum]
MSLGHNAWPPGNIRPPDDLQDSPRPVNGLVKTLSGSRTPQIRGSVGAEAQNPSSTSDADIAPEEDPRIAQFRELYRRSEAKISALFSGRYSDDNPAAGETTEASEAEPERVDDAPPPSAAPRKSARKLDDDDYDDYDDDDEDEEMDDAVESPLKTKSAAASQEPSGAAPLAPRPSVSMTDGLKEPKKETMEDLRKQLEEDKKATEEAARRSFHTLFYTLENDRDAMLDQQRLEESERQVEAEISGQANMGGNNVSGAANGYSSLSNTNLGASSLTLKNLIARIDKKRDRVQASDAELRSLLSEVRKNRSKWANEDKVGQEELYEAAEKVLSELKAMTEHSTAFLTRVNKRDAPDYHTIIKHPMDLGSMTKKLKGLQYRSKQDFVDDLTLIWANCLKYNTNTEHPLRKHALYMRKETEKLVPLIPDIVIRDRAEVEAEERRLQLADNDGAEESDDEPIMSSRGRKAPGKKTSKKGTAPSRNTPSPARAPSTQPPAPARADSDATGEASQNGFSTPPPGSNTPSDPAGPGAIATASQDDTMDIDGPSTSTTALSAMLVSGGVEPEDPEYKVWKQVTKRDRARVAAERHRLLRGDKLNAEEPALLRSKAGMRRWLRHQKQATIEADKSRDGDPQAMEPEAAGESLAEGIEVEEDQMLPYYYDVMSGVPDLPERLLWKEDAQGNVVDASEEFLHMLRKGEFIQPDSKLTRKMNSNMRQMQETRKICSKIGIVKQMQLQSQMYQNQFQKYQPEPFQEQDIEPHVMNDNGPVIAPWACRAALQRSVAKVFYHTGFEEYQPSALEAVTDIAADFFHKLGSTFKSYMETPKVPTTEPHETTPSTAEWKPAYTHSEIVLHTLSTVGIHIDELESYIKDDVDRLGTKLTTANDRLRSLLTELLRPALEGGEDGSNAFADGSEQFVGGDFAEDIDEDFFGFKELGLDREFGLSTLSVPLHLLQNRMFNAANPQNASVSPTVTLFAPPPPYGRISTDNLSRQIGLLQEFFKGKLDANGDEPLVEDLELPPKQRPMAIKPRLPASGKIPQSSLAGLTSPQKRAAPPMASKSSGAEPSKKKTKKNSGVALEMPNFNPDGEGDQATGDPAANANMQTEDIGLGDGAGESMTNGA